MEGEVEGLDEVGAEPNAAAPVGAWVANLRNVRFLSMQLRRSVTCWVHKYIPSGVLKPPKRFVNFVACRHLDRHSRFWMSRCWLSRFCLSRFRQCHTCISGSNHGHGTSAWRFTVELVTDFDCPDVDCPDFDCAIHASMGQITVTELQDGAVAWW